MALRIASLAPSNTEILCALGVDDELVAVTQFCDFPSSVRSKPHLKGWVKMDLNDIQAVQASLVATSTICQDRLRAKIEKAGIRHFHVDPRTVQDVAESFVTLGRMVGREKAAHEMKKNFFETLKSIALKRTPTAYRPRVYCEEWHRPPTVSGNWVPELMKIAGANYFPVETGSLSRAITDEEICTFNPELIVFSICGVATQFDPAEIFRRDSWQAIQAVQEGNVFTLDDSYLNRPGPRLVEGTALVQSLIGELFWNWNTVESDLRVRKIKL